MSDKTKEELEQALVEARKVIEFYASGNNYIRLTLAEEGGGMGKVVYSLTALKNFVDIPHERAREWLKKWGG